jgi:hypothetical protein
MALATQVTKYTPYGRQGYATFSTTDQTGELDCGGLTVIKSVVFTPVAAAPDADEVLFVTETVNAAGEIQIPADAAGKITVNRTGASATADFGFLFRIEGY